MTFNYDVADLSTNGITQVRRIVGDTVDEFHEFEDEELGFFLDQNANNIYYASSQALDALASKYAKYADKQVGDLKIRYSDISKSYAARAQEMYAAFPNTFVAFPLAGGISVSGKAANRADTDVVQPSFAVDMMENVPSRVEVA